MARSEDLYPLPPEGLTIKGIAVHNGGPARGRSTLSLGEEVVCTYEQLQWVKPVATIVAPGCEYKLGEKLTHYPEGAIPVRSFFKRL